MVQNMDAKSTVVKEEVICKKKWNICDIVSDKEKGRYVMSMVQLEKIFPCNVSYSGIY